MQKFVGTWCFQDDLSATSQNDSGGDSLQLKFTQQPSETQSQGVIEYRCGDLFPTPAEGELIDPLQHQGVFEWIHFDSGKQQGRCGTDYFGLGRLYYASTPGNLFISNDIFLLAKEIGSTELNLLACTMLLALGECIGRHTLINGIFRLGHGDVLEFDKYEFRVTTEWRLTPPDTPVSPSQFITESNKRLITALNNTAEWRGARTCLLSGGDDSRRIAAGLNIVGLDVDFVCQRYIGPGGYDEDTIPAQMIADSLQAELTIIDACSAKEIETDASATLLLTNAESMSHGWLQKTLRQISSGSLVYDGLAGGELMNGHYVKAFPECAEHFGRLELLTETLLTRCALRLRPALKDALADVLFDALKGLPETPYRMTQFYLCNHTRRNTGSVAAIMREKELTPFMPFATKEMAEQALTLDYRKHLGSYYQGLATHALNPKLAEVPTTRLGFSDEYKVDLRHLIPAASKAEVSVGSTNIVLIARLLSMKESLYMLLSDMLGLHEKHFWRSVPLRKLGLIADVVSACGAHDDQIGRVFTVERTH